MTKKFVRHPKQSIEGMQSNEAEVGLSQQVQALPDIEQQLDGLLETISQDIAVATDLNSDSVKGKVAPPESNRINKILGKNSNKPSDEDWLRRVESLRRSIAESKMCSRLLLAVGAAGLLLSAYSMPMQGNRFAISGLVLSCYALVLGGGCFVALAMASQVCDQQRRRAIPFGDAEARRALPTLKFLYRVSLVAGFCIMAWVIQEATSQRFLLVTAALRLKFAVIGMSLFALGLQLRCASVLLRSITEASATRE